jgi:RNA 3'-terminal phosphate cyclase (ATP)
MRAPASSLVFDGSYGEGGGALLRTALAMSAITQQTVQISQIRGATRYPGLDLEDLALISALEISCAAEVSPVGPGVDHVVFSPKRTPKNLVETVGGETYGSNRHANALILVNTLQGVLVHAGAYSTLTAKGETFGNNTLSFDSYSACTAEALKKFGCYAYPKLIEGGFGRESEGTVVLDIEPSRVDGLEWADRGALQSVTALIAYSHIGEAIPQRAASHLMTLSRQAKLQFEIELKKVEAVSPGVHVTICAKFERGFGSGSMMGTRGVRIESVATSAFDQLFDFLQSKAAVDSYLADQILLTSVFATAPVTFSVSNISSRLLTAIWVIKQFMPIHITVNGQEGQAGLVSIRRG